MILHRAKTKNLTSMASSASVEDFEAQLIESMETDGISALSVLVFKDDDILYEGIFGTSSIEEDIVLEKDHLFLLASVSKVYTATALLQLFEKGDFELDDPINEMLDFDVIHSSYPSTEITYRMLLTHTSGISDSEAVSGLYCWGKDCDESLEGLMKSYLEPEGDYYDEEENFSESEPGTSYEYSNMGSALIGVLVESISGMDFNEYCKKNIFEPLGLENTYWRLDEIENVIVQPYDYSDGEYSLIEQYTWTDYPNGGIRSSALDMYKFFRAFTHDGMSNGYQLLKEETISEMMRPQIPDLEEAMGLHMFGYPSADAWGHDGQEMGATAFAGVNKDSKIGVIVLCNSGEAHVADIAAAAFEAFTEL